MYSRRCASPTLPRNLESGILRIFGKISPWFLVTCLWLHLWLPCIGHKWRKSPEKNADTTLVATDGFPQNIRATVDVVLAPINLSFCIHMTQICTQDGILATMVVYGLNFFSKSPESTHRLHPSTTLLHCHCALSRT